MNDKFIYQCPECSSRFDAGEIRYLCPVCSVQNAMDKPPHGVLKVLYDYEMLGKKYAGHDGFKRLEQHQFLPLLPVNKPESFGFLRVGKTPVYRVKSDEYPSLSLFLKDDSQNPTFSYKDRASVMVSAFAAEHHISTIAAASTGNAGSSIAGICAAQRQKSVVFVPATAPAGKLTQIVMYGATIVPVDANYDTAFDLSIAMSDFFGWYNRNTAYNPITIEGKKTAAYEIFSSFHGVLPDRIFVPVGDGVIISGIYKGFEDLLRMQIIDKMPVIVAVQSAQSKNLAANMDTDVFTLYPSTTLADSISVDIPRNFIMAKSFLQQYKGECVVVDDNEILQALAILSKQFGIFSEPAGAAAYAGMMKYYADTKSINHRCLIMLTGSGLKDLKPAARLINMPKPVFPDKENVIKYLKNFF